MTPRFSKNHRESFGLSVKDTITIVASGNYGAFPVIRVPVKSVGKFLLLHLPPPAQESLGTPLVVNSYFYHTTIDPNPSLNDSLSEG